MITRNFVVGKLVDPKIILRKLKKNKKLEKKSTSIISYTNCQKETLSENVITRTTIRKASREQASQISKNRIAILETACEMFTRQFGGLL